MSCLKCGKETKDNKVFCDSCLSAMADYPVKPDAVITLPRRPAETEIKPVRKRPMQPEEQLAIMHKRVRRLIAALSAVTVLLALSVAALIHTYKNDQPESTVGHNYMINTGRRP